MLKIIKLSLDFIKYFARRNTYVYILSKGFRVRGRGFDIAPLVYFPWFIRKRNNRGECQRSSPWAREQGVTASSQNN